MSTTPHDRHSPCPLFSIVPPSPTEAAPTAMEMETSMASSNGTRFTTDNPLEISHISGLTDLTQLDAANWSWLNTSSFFGGRSPNHSDTDSIAEIPSFQEATNRATPTPEVAYELFVEECSVLYSDIQNALDDHGHPDSVTTDADDDDEDSVSCLIERFDQRLQRLKITSTRLDVTPEVRAVVELRMQTINRAMERLQLRQVTEPPTPTSAASSSAGFPRSSPMAELRKLLVKIDQQLDEFRHGISDAVADSDLPVLYRLRADQQAFQLQLETDGQSLLSAARRNLESQVAQPKSQRNLRLLEGRLLAAWLRNLENLEILGRLISDLEATSPLGNDCVSSSDDEEPVFKRRRTLSSTNKSVNDEDPSSLPAASSSTSDAPVMAPTATSSLSPVPDSPLHLSGSSGSGKSGPLLLEGRPDVGYSSGENSLHEAVLSDDASSGAPASASPTNFSHTSSPTRVSPDERRRRLTTSPNKEFYRTVPLDEAGCTDTECLLPSSPAEAAEVIPLDPTGPSAFDSDEDDIFDDVVMAAVGGLLNSAGAEDSLSNTHQNDYEEIMNLVDNESAGFDGGDTSPNGTRWRELKSSARRVSCVQRRSIATTTTSTSGMAHSESGDASSEESDVAASRARSSFPFSPAMTTPLAATAFRPPLPHSSKKRRFKKAARPQNIYFQKQSLTNVGMEESVYIFQASNPSLNADPMSQSLHSTRGSKRRLEKSGKMHRSVSDHVEAFATKGRVNSFQNVQSNSFHAQLAEFGHPLYSSTLRRPSPQSVSVTSRRDSLSSDASSTSNGTVSDAGDAHYEWDDYRDPQHLCPVVDMEVSVSSILGDTLIDEDFASQLPDVTEELETAIHDSRNDYERSRCAMDNADVDEPENGEVHVAVRNLARENVKRLTAIVKAVPRASNEKQVDEADYHIKRWNDLLETVGPGDLSDPLIAKEREVETLKTVQSGIAAIQQAFESIKAVDATGMKLDDVQSFITGRKQLVAAVKAKRRELEQLADENTGLNTFDFGMTLRSVEETLQSVSAKTNQLEASLDRYTELGCLSVALNDLRAKLQAVSTDSSARNSGAIEGIRGDLKACEKRLRALEGVCNRLTTQLSELTELSGRPKPTKESQYWQQYRAYKDNLLTLQTCFDDLLASSPEPVHPSPPIPSSPVRRRRHQTASRTSETVHPLLQHGNFGSSMVSSTTQTSTTESVATQHAADERSFIARAMQTLSNSRLARVLFASGVVVFFLALFYFFGYDDQHPNNWRRAFGPQLYYVNGAPPS